MFSKKKKKLTTYLRIMSGASVSLQKISKAEKFLLRAINRVKCYNILRPRSRRFLLALTSKFHVDNKLCVGSTQENTFTVSVTFKTFGEKKNPDLKRYLGRSKFSQLIKLKFAIVSSSSRYVTTKNSH